MIRAVIALSMSAASAGGFAAGSDSATLRSAAPWWEKVTVTVPAAGANPSCSFTSSAARARECGVEDSGALGDIAAGAGQLTKITFERRFLPGLAAPAHDVLADGEILLGAQVLKLAIGGDGRVARCNIVAKAGDMTPDYGCREVAAEKFEAGAREAAKTGYLTVLVYAHTENLS